MNKDFRSGFVAVIGRPNVGKSTLINQLVRKKLAIVSEKPQTTRHQIRAVINRPGAQLIFVDTPGLHKPKDALGRRLNRTVRNALSEADVILFLVDAAAGIGTGDAFIARELIKVKTPIILALNKVDLLKSAELVKQEDVAARLGKYTERINISALTGNGLENLVDGLTELLPSGPRYYPEGMISDQPEKVVMAEFVREKVLELTREEIPYSVAVEIEEVSARPKKDLVDVHGWIYVEHDSQKGIILGERGQMLKEIGKRARADLQNLLGSQIYLDLRVKVKKNWRRDSRLVDQLGY